MLGALFERHPSVQTAGFGPGSYKEGLDGMRRLDAELGHPWQSYRCIHVAGTNGKGSVCSMLAAALAASGLKTGLYTSPHMTDFRERAKIIEGNSFRMIPEQAVWDFVHGHRLDGLSFFEITTGLAFSWFADEGVDVAVIETGLGGRLDSTNIILPELTAITSIGLDHCAMLGNTREQIAAEKAGIFKPGVPALVSLRDDETAPVFERTAKAIGCPLHFADELSEDFSIAGSDLNGPQQPVNFRCALATLQLLGLETTPEIIRAMHNAAHISGLRGRWETLCDNPLTICDIGHNPAALEQNFKRLEAYRRPLLMVFGIMADKDADGIIALLPKKARYFLAAPKTPRALPAEELARKMAGFDTTVCRDIKSAVENAKKEAEKTDNCIIYIGGSNYVVSEALE